MISGILAGGIPGFRFELCCFLHPLLWPMVILWFFPVVVLFYGPANMTHKLSSARAEMILSYHLLPQQIFFTHNWYLSRHCFVVVWFFCVLFWLFLSVFVFGVVFAFGFFVFRFLFSGNVTRE